MIGLTFRLLHALPPEAYDAAFAAAQAAGVDTIVLVPHQYALLTPVPAGGDVVTRPPWAPRTLIWSETAQMAGGVGNSPPLANVEEIGRLVLARGLHLVLKPHIDPGFLHNGEYGVGGWRGYISVKDIYHTPPAWRDMSRAWASAYRAFLGPYVTLAKRLAAGLVLGCELISVTRELGAAFWYDLATWVQARGFNGLLTYAANWAGEDGLDPLWGHPAITHVGVDWYATPQLWEERAAAWMAAAVRAHKPLLQTEGGCGNWRTDTQAAIDNPGADPPRDAQGHIIAVQDDQQQVVFWQRVDATFPGVDRFVWEAEVVGLPPEPISHNVLERPCEGLALRP